MGVANLSPDQSDSVLKSPAPLWATLIATFFGVGKIKPGPGTWGSAATVLVWYLLSRFIPLPWQTLAATLLAIFVIVIGIPVATLSARTAAKKDPQFVVID